MIISTSIPTRTKENKSGLVGGINLRAIGICSQECLHEEDRYIEKKKEKSPLQNLFLFTTQNKQDNNKSQRQKKKKKRRQ